MADASDAHPDTGSSPAAAPATTPAHGHNGGHRHHRRHRRRRPEWLVLPDGRRLLVAGSEEAERLRARHASDDSAAAPPVEVVVHGSPEHEAALRASQEHHAAQRAALRATHGAAVYDAYDEATQAAERSAAALAALATERARAARAQANEDADAASAASHLGHNFSKFGYSANLRTIGRGESVQHASRQGSRQGCRRGSQQTSRQGSRQASTVGLATEGAGAAAAGSAHPPIDEEGGDNMTWSGSGSDNDGDLSDTASVSSTASSSFSSHGHHGGIVPAWQDPNNGRGMPFFRRPIVKQYYHKGLLWRESGETTVQSFELFFDLLYVGILAINGDHAAEVADGRELLRFLVTFCTSWKIWSDVTQLVSWFETNDVAQRVELLVLYALLLGVTVNNVQTFGGWAGSEGADTYPALVAFYVTARLFMALYCTLTGFLVPMVRGTMLCQTGLIVVGAALWIASIHLAMPERLACTFVALAFDLFGGSLIVGTFRWAMVHSGHGVGRWLMERVFAFYPMLNIEHKVERTNAYMSLVLGYAVVGVIYQSSGRSHEEERGEGEGEPQQQHAYYGVNAFLGKAILGLVQAFVFNWLYFDIDGADIHVHAIRRRPESAYIWQYAHLVFTLAFILSSAALTHLVVATDCRNAPYAALTETYQGRSEPEVSLGLRLYYSTGLGVALAALAVIAACHQHKVAGKTHRLSKTVRLANRLAVAAVFCALPAAQGLTSLQLVAIATGLIVYVLVVDLVGVSAPGQNLFPWRRRDAAPEEGGADGNGTADADTPRYTAQCSRKRLREVLGSNGNNTGNTGNTGKDGGESGRSSDQPAVDVNVLTQADKTGAIYIE